MFSAVVSRLIILLFGTLYPAYASYKAVKTKNVKEYVKWMMYWIVFALFTCAETFTDVFLSWFPFYYELKIIIVIWLLSPATKGSSILYRKFVHPLLSRREQEIDEYISKAKEQGYHTVLHLGSKGVNYATTVIMQTAIKNLNLPTQVLASSQSDSNLNQLLNSNNGNNDEMDFPIKRSLSLDNMEVLEMSSDNDEGNETDDNDNQEQEQTIKEKPKPVKKSKTSGNGGRLSKKTKSSGITKRSTRSRIAVADSDDD